MRLDLICRYIIIAVSALIDDFQVDRNLDLCNTIISTASTLLIMSYQVRQKLQKEPPVSNALQPTLRQPLSLQQVSILCVISNLESFPPDILALLPLKFRRDLLLFLPPADIFQLEQTSVVDGIDMENEIWREVYERYDYEVARTAHINPDKPDLRAFYLRHRHDVSRFPKAVESRKHIVSSSAPLTWKASFLSCIFAFLLHMRPFQVSTDLTNFCRIYSSSAGERNYIVFLQLLFCTQFFTLKQIKSLRGFPLKAFGVTIHLSRYRQFFFPKNEPFQIPHWIHFLLVKCHLEAPCSMIIDEQYFSWDETDMTDGSQNVVIFQNFCRKVKDVKLHLHCKYPPKGVPIPQIDAAIRKLLQLFVIILSYHQSGVPQLESVDIDECVATFRADSVKCHGRDNYMFNSMLQKLFLHPVLSIQDLPSIIHQFRTLKHVCIHGFNTEIEMSTISSLLVILQNQPLETFLVCGPHIVGDEIQQAHLQQALWSTFSSPISSTCTSITLNKISKLPLLLLLWLVQKFLYSPSNGPQTLTLTDCEIDYSIDPDENNLKCTPPSSCLALPHKSLHISQLNVKPALIKALSCLPSLVLDSLQFSSYWKDEVKPGPMDLLDAFFNTDSICKIKCLLYRFRRGYRYRYVSKPQDSEQIVHMFTIAQKLPETAVTLECETTLHYMQDLFVCVHTAWKNSGGKMLDNLLIRFDKTDPFCKTHFQSLLESAISTHSINTIATTVEVSVAKQVCYSSVR